MMINHRIFERWFLCERFIFQRQLAYCVLRWRLSLILIIISFRFLKFWNGSFTLYIQIYIFVFIFCCYRHTLLYCIMCCNSLFSLRLCTYILYMMCTVYDILFEWFNCSYEKRLDSNINLIYMPTRSKIGGHIVFVLSVICPPLWNFYLANNFWTVVDRASIFHMSILLSRPSVGTIKFYPVTLTLEFHPFFKTL